MDELKNKSALTKAAVNNLTLSDKQQYCKECVSFNEFNISLASVYNLDALDTLLDDPKCASCGQIATNRCSRCKGEWYCG